MEQIWRWYGPNDLVILVDVCQTGATGVVTALHHIPSGEVWTVDEILKRKATIGQAGLVWSVVESVPIHEDIKARSGNYRQWIVNYQQSLRNLAECGIRTVCYNFIPVLDWTRTDLEYALSDGFRALRLDQVEFTAFELHILERPGAEADYTAEEIARAHERFTTMSEEDKARLTRSIIAGLPGVEEGYMLDQSRQHFERYKDIDKVALRENLAAFLKVIIPVAEEVGVRTMVHPDDPPRPILGLPHTVSTVEDMRWMIDTVDSMANGFTMRTDSYGIRADNDLVDTIKQFGSHIYFTHLRSTLYEDNPKIFREAVHLNGDVDMHEVVKAIAEEEQCHKAKGEEDLIPMHPDHGHQMLDDLKKKTNPGCSATGRLKSLAEIRSAETTIQRAFFSRQSSVAGRLSGRLFPFPPVGLSDGIQSSR